MKLLETNKEKVAKIAYLLILTGPACTALINWSDKRNGNEMMSALTKKMKDNEQDNNITIGNKRINRPDTETWRVATTLANEIYETVVEISLGSKTKLLNKIIEYKGLTAVKSFQIEQETLKTRIISSMEFR